MITLIILCLLFVARADDDGYKIPEDVYPEKVKVISTEGEPFLKRSGSSFTGFVPDLLDELSRMANFKYDLELLGDRGNQYGSKDNDGEWSGMVGAVLRGGNDEARMAAGPLSITDERREVISFSKAWMETELVFLVRRDIGAATVEDLYDVPGIKFAILKGGSTEAKIKQSERKTDRLLQLLKEEDYVYDMKSTMQRLTKEKLAFLVESPFARYTANHECKVKLINTGIKMHGYGFGVKKNGNHNDLIRLIDEALNNMKITGRIEKMENKYWGVGPCSSAGRVAASFALLLLHAVYVAVNCVV